MLVLETIAKIRRAFFVQGKSIKLICRDLGVSRKVVRKVIRSEATEFRYEREAQPLPKIGPWSDKLDQLLVANEGKASRQRLTLIRLFEELRGWGYTGGYDAVRRYARRWSKERGATTAAAYVPLSFAPGEAYQFDWSHEVVLLNGATVTVKVAHVRLCHSRMLFVRAYPRETQEMVFDAHDRAFALFKGTCQRECPVVGVEHHLLRLARISSHEQHAAMAEPDVCHLHGHRRAVQQDDLVAPVELVGFTWREAPRHIGGSRRGAALLAPPSGVAPHGVVAAGITAATQFLEQADQRQALPRRLTFIRRQQLDRKSTR